jgi:FMN phosphatase YigB (HAD superfamily)
MTAHRDPVNTVLLDFDGVSGCVNVDRVLRATSEIRQWFRIDPVELLQRYFYENRRNVELDLGQVGVFDVRETMRAELWQGPAEIWHEWWRSVEEAYEISQPIATLIDRWCCRLCFILVTDNHRDFPAWFRRRRDFSSRFDKLICSAELGVKKPDPKIFLHAVGGDAGRFRHTVYLDDNYDNVAAAREMGIRAVHVTNIAAAADELEGLLKNADRNDGCGT